MGSHHPWEAAIRETVATFEGCWGVQRSDVLRRFLVNVLLQPSLCCCRADGSGPHAFIYCSSLPPPMSSSSLWLSLLALCWLSCASCHVRVSHVSYTTYNGACNLIVHASLGQLCLSLDANGLGTSQGNLQWKTASG